MTLPPFNLARKSLYWLSHMVDHYNDGSALQLLWWQASIGPLGMNEHVARVHWKART